MPDNLPSANPVEFSPEHLIRSLRRARSREEKFDEFADGYIWVLLAVFGLACVFGFARAGLGALLGELSQAIMLPSAVLGLELVLLLAALALPGMVLKLLLRLGPCALTPAQAAWWLSLPISFRGLLRSRLRRALWIGALGYTAVWVLWCALAASVVSGIRPWMFLVGGGAAVSTGWALAALAVTAQAHGKQAVLARVATSLLWLPVVLSLGVWALVGLAQLPEPDVSLWLGYPAGWLGLLLVALLMALVCHLLAGRAVQSIAPKMLRAAGRRQRTVRAALLVMDPGVVRHVLQGDRKPLKPPATGFGARMRHQPVVAQILVLRIWRGGLWKPLASQVLGLTLLLVMVSGAANAATLGLGLLLLLVGLINFICVAGEPLMTDRGLGRMLGLGAQSISRAVVGTLAIPTVLVLGSWSVAVAGLLTPAVAPGMLVPAVLLGAAGVFSGATQRASRGSHDWEAELYNSGTQFSGLGSLWYLTRGMWAGVLGSAPLFFVLLPGPAVWAPWLVAMAAAVPGMRYLCSGK